MKGSQTTGREGRGAWVRVDVLGREKGENGAKKKIMYNLRALLSLLISHSHFHSRIRLFLNHVIQNLVLIIH